MEGYSRKDEGCLQFLDLIPKEKRDWVIKSAEQTSHGLSEEKKLELRLGPPGGDSDCDWTTIKESPWLHHHQAKPRFLLHLPTVMKESSQPCSNNKVAEMKTSEKKAFSPAPANTAVPNSSSAQKRCLTFNFFASFIYFNLLLSFFFSLLLDRVYSLFYSNIIITCFVVHAFFIVSCANGFASLISLSFRLFLSVL